MVDVHSGLNRADVNRSADVSKERLPHAVLDLPSRRLKGLKIEQLLALENLPRPIRMLEVGTGSGGIAHYFGTHPILRCEVSAVDVCDNRLVCDGYKFQLVKGTCLPFEDESFDIVLTNHVIEHVGDAEAQAHHLAEVRRVMKLDGVSYLAVPNRWMLVEPHYKLAFLSWLPHAWRTTYLRAMGKGEIYDCEPLQMKSLEHMLDEAAFRHCNICIPALRTTLEIEKPDSMIARLIRIVPDVCISPFKRIIPTLVYRISRA